MTDEEYKARLKAEHEANKALRREQRDAVPKVDKSPNAAYIKEVPKRPYGLGDMVDLNKWLNLSTGKPRTATVIEVREEYIVCKAEKGYRECVNI